MVRADILNELRMRVDGLCAHVDWPGIGLVLAMALVLSMALTPWPVNLPSEAGPPLTTALVGAAVWGVP